jgi:hypothetical protein
VADHRSQLSKLVPASAKRGASEHVLRLEREREP